MRHRSPTQLPFFQVRRKVQSQLGDFKPTLQMQAVKWDRSSVFSSTNCSQHSESLPFSQSYIKAYEFLLATFLRELAVADVRGAGFDFRSSIGRQPLRYGIRVGLESTSCELEGPLTLLGLPLAPSGSFTLKTSFNLVPLLGSERRVAPELHLAPFCSSALVSRACGWLRPSSSR